MAYCATSSDITLSLSKEEGLFLYCLLGHIDHTKSPVSEIWDALDRVYDCNTPNLWENANENPRVIKCYEEVMRDYFRK